MPDEQRPEPNEDSPIFRMGKPRETLFERQIRQAMDEGRFDNLPHQGKPLPNDDNPHAGEWGLAYKMLKDAGYAPPWIQADKEVREHLARRDAILARVQSNPPSDVGQRRDRDLIERLVHDANRAIERLNSEAPSTRQHRRPLLLAEELAAYDEACRGSQGGAG
jgi:hypothetical protein